MDSHDGKGTLLSSNDGENQDSEVFRVRIIKIAETTISFLEQRLAVMDEKEGTNFEAQTKEHLVIAKAVTSLEELINKMDASINESDLYPQDALEFHKQIEERIKKFSNL